MYLDDEELKYADVLDERVFGYVFRSRHGRMFDHVPDIAPPPAAPMNYPEYVTEREAENILKKNPENGIWLNPHNHFTIPLEGRENEKDRLDAFIAHPDPFRICPVIAPSGAGKTRLISQWMKPYVATFNPDTEWEAGFVVSRGDNNARDPEPWRKWRIEKPTLIVIDYTYAFGNVVEAIFENAKINAKRDTKVRVIVVDHRMPDFLWKKIAGGRPASTDLMQERYIEEPIELKREAENSEMLYHVIAAAANVGEAKKRVKRNNQLIVEALRQLDRMGRAQGDRDTVRHPLFAALMGQAIRKAGNKPVDFSTWGRRDLLEYYFTSLDRMPWSQVVGDESPRSSGFFSGAVVSAAFLRRGLDFADIENHLPRDSKNIVEIAAGVVSAKSTEHIPAFLPDILGEAFLLKFLEASDRHHGSFKAFTAMLSVSSNATEKGIADHFHETTARLVWNLANDDPTSSDVKNGWNSLLKLLDPAIFPENRAMRSAVSFVIADTIEQLTQLSGRILESIEPLPCSDLETARASKRFFEKRKEKLETKFEVDKVLKAIEGDNYLRATIAIFRMFEYSAFERSPIDNGSIEKAARQFSERHGSEFSTVMIADLFGPLRAIPKKTEENTEDSGRTEHFGALALSCVHERSNRNRKIPTSKRCHPSRRFV